MAKRFGAKKKVDNPGQGELPTIQADDPRLRALPPESQIAYALLAKFTGGLVPLPDDPSSK